MANCYRTGYDQMMLERYNPLKNGDDENKYQYHTAPFPPPRTKIDIALNKKWCNSSLPVPKFKNRVWFEGYHNPQVSDDDTALRTHVDNLTKKLSSVCK